MMLADGSSPAKKSIFPLAAICCLLLLGFLIATTIVLALIPIYVPSKQATLDTADTTDDDTFVIRYTSNGNPVTNPSGSLDNIDEINRLLDLGDDAEVTEGFVRTTAGRRRRRRNSIHRQKRDDDAQTDVVLKCKHKKKPSCNTDTCTKKRQEKVDKKIKDRGNMNNFPCRVRTAGKVTRIQISVVFIGVIVSNIDEALIGFGAVQSLIITAVQSGFADDPSTWLFGIVPFAGCSIIIPAGITVTWTRAVLTIPLVKIEIVGVAVFGSGQSSFTCNFPLKIDVRGGGKIRVEATTKTVIFQEKSIIIVRTGGSCGPVGTVIRSPSSSGGENSITVDKEEGPLTCGILPGGVVIFQKRLVFIVVEDGDILSPSCYLNEEQPSVEACTDGCGLYVPSGRKLSTASLAGGVLKMNIAQIDVVAGATLEVGAVGSSDGLECLFPIQMNIFGVFAYVGNGGRIRLPGGNGDSCGINFYGGGKLESSVVILIQVYIRITGIDIGEATRLPIGLVGPWFILIVIDGTIEINIIGPGIRTSTSRSTLFSSIATTTKQDDSESDENGSSSSRTTMRTSIEDDSDSDGDHSSSSTPMSSSTEDDSESGGDHSSSSTAMSSSTEDDSESGGDHSSTLSTMTSSTEDDSESGGDHSSASSTITSSTEDDSESGGDHSSSSSTMTSSTEDDSESAGDHSSSSTTMTISTEDDSESGGEDSSTSSTMSTSAGDDSGDDSKRR